MDTDSEEEEEAINVVCVRCCLKIERGPYLVCKHGRRPVHPHCLAEELDAIILSGKSEEYRRCNCAEEQERDGLVARLEGL